MTGSSGIRPQKRYKPTYIYTVISTTLVLFLLGIIGILILQAQAISSYFKESITLSVIMSGEAREGDIISLQKLLENEPYIKNIQYISKEEAAAQLQEELGEEFLDILDYNPLFDVIHIQIHAQWANPESIQRIVEDLYQQKIVTEVLYPETFVKTVDKIFRQASLILGAVTILFLFISFALINNTLRLAMYSNRFLIRSMQLVGATKWFIIRPFILRALFNGLLSALFASLLLGACLWFVMNQFPGLIIISDLHKFAPISAVIIVLGVVITIGSTYFAVNRYLNMKLDELY